MSSEYLLDDDDVIVTRSDLLGNIVSVNPTMIKVSGYSEQELIGQPHNLLRHPDVPKEVFVDMWTTISQGYTWYGTVKNKRKNGDYYWVSANVAPVFNEEEEIIGYFSVRYAVTAEEKETAQRLCDAIRAGTGKLPNLTIRRFDPLFLFGMLVVLIGLLVDIVAHAVNPAVKLALVGTFISLSGLGIIFARGIALYRPNSVQFKSIHNMVDGRFREPIHGRDAWTNALNLLRIHIGKNMAKKLESIRDSAILNAATNSATTKLMVLDQSLDIISLNESAQDMFYRLEGRLKKAIPNFCAKTLVGQNFDFFHLHASKRKAMIQSLSTVMASEFTIADVTLRITIVPVQLKGKTIAFTVEFDDRTERVLLERRITDSLTHLASLDITDSRNEFFLDSKGLSGFFADLVNHINYAMQIHRQVLETAISHQQKSDFLANVSHELRTPLNSINVLSRLLMKNLENNLTERQVEQLEVIHYAGGDLLNLVNDLLDASKIDAGKMTISLEVIELKTLLTDLKLMFDPLVKMKGLAFEFVIDPRIIPLESDGTRIRQIVKNFLSNALKFTEKGTITLSATCSECGTFTQIQVADTGIGIPSQKLNHIFERFKQADDHATSRKFGGTGLGLSISRDLAHLLGGEIHVESEVGVGSIFALVLHNTDVCNLASPTLEEITKIKVVPTTAFMPTSTKLNIEAISLAEDGYLTSTLNIGELAGKSILVVDDNIRNLFTMTALLENTGMPVVTAQNGHQAYQQLTEGNKIGLLLTDIMMPEMDGYTLIAKIRALPKLANLPIIAISAQTETEGKEKSLTAGANAYLTKPVEADALIHAIKSCLPKK